MHDPLDLPVISAVAERLRAARHELTRRWLDRIAARVSLGAEHIFPSHDLLDHVPLLIDGIADYLENPTDEIGADAPVLAKAMELGELRHAQGFSAHEILKEYEILGGVLYAFLTETIETLDVEWGPADLLACSQRLFRSICVMQQVTTTQYLRIAGSAVRDRQERLRSFNRMVSHELKNRISAVHGASSMLQEPGIEDDSQQRHRFLAMIDRNIKEMQWVLQDLLSLSRTDGDSRSQRHVLLPEAAAEAVRQLREMARERGVAIRLAGDLPRIEVDAGALELCLVNYLSNAIKYCDPRKPERWVEVRASRVRGSDEGADEIVIEVHDNGLGVSPEAREHLFERFYRDPKVSGVEGTGLGLSIVRETVEAIGGRAWAEFDDPGGSCSIFKLALPARRATDV